MGDGEKTPHIRSANSRNRHLKQPPRMGRHLPNKTIPRILRSWHLLGIYDHSKSPPPLLPTTHLNLLTNCSRTIRKKRHTETIIHDILPNRTLLSPHTTNTHSLHNLPQRNTQNNLHRRLHSRHTPSPDILNRNAPIRTLNDTTNSNNRIRKTETRSTDHHHRSNRKRHTQPDTHKTVRNHRSKHRHPLFIIIHPHSILPTHTKDHQIHHPQRQIHKDTHITHRNDHSDLHDQTHNPKPTTRTHHINHNTTSHIPHTPTDPASTERRRPDTPRNDTTQDEDTCRYRETYTQSTEKRRIMTL